MWKYIITWGVYIMGMANDHPAQRYERIYSDTAYFNNRDTAIQFIGRAQQFGGYMRYPYVKESGHGKAFYFKLDSIKIK